MASREEALLTRVIEIAAAKRTYQRLLFHIAEACLQYCAESRPTTTCLLKQLHIAQQFFASGAFLGMLFSDAHARKEKFSSRLSLFDVSAVVLCEQC